MAQEKRKPGFQKGHKLSKGRAPLTPEARTLRQLTTNDFILKTNQYIWATKDELKAIMENPNTISLDRMIISIILKGEEWGDQNRTEWLLARTIGPIVIETKNTNTQTIVYKTDWGNTSEPTDGNADQGDPAKE